ncbi:protein CREG1 [Hyalella azteca]|uniref:Protein CREG1 n=1 Tax=Hyalella azteca TaxID=294128 RepID=A0A8B7P0H8_HYAAZ|nr:protein CREG1 [Hyalella azteca]
MTVEYNELDGLSRPTSSRKRHSGCGLAVVTLILFVVTGISALVVWKVCFPSGGFGGVFVDNGALAHHYPPPPPHTEYAAVARYIIHISDWATLATISTHANITGYPFANVFSISDGITSNSTGNPYFYLTDLELSVHDLKADPRASLTASLAQSSYCRQRRLDPQDPVCAHVILTGEIVKIKNGTAEAAAAQQALFSRHPEMQDWPQDHGWFVARLAIRHIYLLDYFGGAKVIDPQDYYAAQPF